MPTRYIPSGLSNLAVRRRAGVLGRYNIVLSGGMCLNDFYLIDDYLQVEVKNFGQLLPNFKSEVYILKVLASKESFDQCDVFYIVPIEINGVPYSGDEVEIPFDLITGILENNTLGNFADIYASTNPIRKQIPVRYTVGFSVTELWDYIENNACPSV